MSATSPCTPCCPTPQTVNVPGIQGDPATDGTDGVDAFTLTTSDNALPGTVGTNVTFDVADSSWMVVGQNVVCSGPANFVVVTVPTLLSVTLRFLGYPGDLPPSSAILTGAKIGPAGMRGPSPYYYTQTGADLTAASYMEVIEVTANSKTITLPTAVGVTGKTYTIKLSAAGSTTVATTGGETIDGLATYLVRGQNSFVTVISDGTNWQIIVRYGNHYTVTAADLPLTAAMDYIEVTADNKNMSLPTAVGIIGKVYTVKQTASYTSGTAVTPLGAETIDGVNAAKTIAVTNGFIQVVSNGAGWIMLFNKLT